MNTAPVSLQVRSEFDEDFSELVPCSSVSAALEAFNAVCAVLPDTCAVRLLVRGEIKAERGAKVIHGIGRLQQN